MLIVSEQVGLDGATRFHGAGYGWAQDSEILPRAGSEVFRGALNLICVCFYIFALGMASISEAKDSHRDERKSVTEQYLFEVIRMNRFDKLKEYLDENPDVINRQFRGSTILAVSASWGRVQMVELLLRLGADPNAAADATKSPLMEAVLGIPGLSVIKDSSKELQAQNVRDYIRVMHALINAGAEYKKPAFKLDGPFDGHLE